MPARSWVGQPLSHNHASDNIVYTHPIVYYIASAVFPCYIVHVHARMIQAMLSSSQLTEVSDGAYVCSVYQHAHRWVNLSVSYWQVSN